MRPRLVDRGAGGGPALPAGWLEKVAVCLEAAGPPEWPLDLVLVADAEMARLNAVWRGGEGTTDVLSFAYLESAGAGPPDLAAGAGGAARALWRDAVEARAGAPVGEVVLAPAYVAERCRSEGWSYEHELAMLAVHGALHVLGWEHDDPERTARMRAQEATLLRRAGWPHPLLEGGKDAPWQGT